DASVQNATLARAQEWSRGRLSVLDKQIGKSNKYLCGDDITIADYMGVCYVTVGEVVHLKYDAYPNITRWIDTMKSRATWPKPNEGFYTYFVGGYKDGKFLGL